MKTKVYLTECPKQRFPCDRKFKNNDNPITDKGKSSKGSGNK